MRQEAVLSARMRLAIRGLRFLIIPTVSVQWAAWQPYVYYGTGNRTYVNS